jgi:hypothetical protein
MLIPRFDSSKLCHGCSSKILPVRCAPNQARDKKGDVNNAA